MRFPGAAALALLLLACSVGAQAQITDSALSDAISQAMAKVLHTQSSTGGIAASMGQVGSAFGSMTGAFGAAFHNAGAQAEAALAAFESQYCTPATFTPSKKKPATFVGHSMAITFSMGNCTFNESKWIHDDVKQLECVEPSISYTKSPANFTSKYHTAPVFKSKECKVTKTFGEPVEKVLFVFDGTQAPDITSLTAQITEEVKKVLGTMSSGVADMVGHSKGLLKGMMGGAAGGAPAFAYQ